MEKETQIKKFLNSAEKYVNDGELVFRVELDKNLPARDLDRSRLEVINQIKDLLNNFVNGEITLKDFKSNNDSINKRNRFWGFKGINGQMFFNMLYNLSKKKGILEDLNDILKICLKIPNNIEEAKNKIQILLKFIDNLFQLADSKRECPRKKSVLFYLSYFWQIQDSKKWPIFYNSLEITLKNLGYLIVEEDLTEYYEKFYRLNLNMENLLKKDYPEKSNLWFVEHILWYYYQNQIKVKKPKEVSVKESGKEEVSLDEFLPPIVADLDLVAENNEIIRKKYDEKQIDNIFEEKCFHLFKMLGFAVEKLGIGKRDADGIALAKQNGFAIIYDCKMREKGYSLRTDDRIIEEYILTNKRRLSKEYGINRLYFFIISSRFNKIDRGSINDIRIKTGVKEIIFIRAEQLLNILKNKLITPSIDLEDLERLFSTSGVLEDESLGELGS